MSEDKIKDSAEYKRWRIYNIVGHHRKSSVSYLNTFSRSPITKQSVTLIIDKINMFEEGQIILEQRYRVIKKLGGGAFGEIYKGK